MSPTITLDLADLAVGERMTFTRLPDDTFQIVKGAAVAGPVAGWGAAESDIIARWKGFRSDTGAVTLADHLRSDGVKITAPKTRKAGKLPEPYLRFEVPAKSYKSLSGYIDTAHLIINSTKSVPALKDIKGGWLRSNGGELLFDVDDLDLCLSVIEAMKQI